MKNTLVLLSKFSLLEVASLTDELAFDETASSSGNNKVFSVLLGDAVPASSHGKTARASIPLTVMPML